MCNLAKRAVVRVLDAVVDPFAWTSAAWVFHALYFGLLHSRNIDEKCHLNGRKQA